VWSMDAQSGGGSSKCLFLLLGMLTVPGEGKTNIVVCTGNGLLASVYGQQKRKNRAYFFPSSDLKVSEHASFFFASPHWSL